MPLMVQNEMAGPTVINMRDMDPLILGPKDSPLGDDVQRTPDAAAEDINFMKALDGGIISIVSAPTEVTSKLEKQQVAYRQQRDERQAKVSASLDRQQDNDMVMESCIGPNPSGRGQCGQGVPVRSRQRGKKPPLCPTHDGLRNQYVLSEDVNAPLDSDGKTPQSWKRVTAGEALPSQAAV